MNKEYKNNLIPEEQFQATLAEAGQLGLTAAEKAAIRERLVTFINQHSLKPAQAEVLSVSGKRSRPVNRFLLLPPLKIASAIAAVMLLVTGSLSLAAERALPGDFLYPIKIHLNEQARALVAISPEAKGNFAVWRTERRLQEAAALIAQGRFDVIAQANLETHLETETAEVKKTFTQLSQEKSSLKPLELSSRLETVLRVHATVLSDLAPAQPNKKNATAIQSFKEKVETEIGALNQIRAVLEQRTKQEFTTTAETEAKLMIENKLKAAETKIAELRKTLLQAATTSKINTRIATEAEAKLQAAFDAASESRAQLERGTFAEAFLLSQKAHRLATEAQLFVETHKQLELTVGTAGIKIDTGTEEGGDTGITVLTASTSTNQPMPDKQEDLPRRELQ